MWPNFYTSAWRWKAYMWERSVRVQSQMYRNLKFSPWMLIIWRLTTGCFVFSLLYEWMNILTVAGCLCSRWREWQGCRVSLLGNTDSAVSSQPPLMISLKFVITHNNTRNYFVLHTEFWSAIKIRDETEWSKKCLKYFLCTIAMGE